MLEMSKPEAPRKRWMALAVIVTAALMVVLDATITNIALPSAQHELHFSSVDRQWVVSAYTLSFGSLLLFGGRLTDLLGRKAMFMAGLAGFAIASAIGGASTSFVMLVSARACQGVFAALLSPAALSLLATTFIDPKERGKAFGVYSAVAAGGGAVGLLLGGILTSYLSWRWCLYVNLIFAGIALGGAFMFLERQPRTRARLDVLGVVAVSSGMFCIVFGFSNAATHGWETASTYSFFIAGGILLVAFVFWMSQAASPLLPLLIVANRNRGAAYLSILIAGAGLFGMFLILTYYMQQTLGYSPVLTGIASVPMAACIGIASNVANIILMPRFGPRPLVIIGLLLDASGSAWLTRIGMHSEYVGTVLGPTMVVGLGIGFVISTAFNTGTFGVAANDAGVASAATNTGQQLGGSIGIALLNTIAAGSTTSFLDKRIHGQPARGLIQAAVIHGYTTAFWWMAGIFAAAAIICGALMRGGTLHAPSLTRTVSAPDTEAPPAPEFNDTIP